MSTDWDDAYANGAYIAGAADYPPRWAAQAEAFRSAMRTAGRAELDLAYGPGARQVLDLFMPEQAPRGLAVFVHGGYWRAFDKSSWSHLAAGMLAHGWAVALPSYTIAPEASIPGMTREIGQAIGYVAPRVAGPIHLAGHSAGGHLVTRMACTNAPIAEDVQSRIAHVLSISGLHDLRPLVHTAMNDEWKMSATDARAESAALLDPVAGLSLTAWVGADERPEFLRQSDLIGNIWFGLGVETRVVREAGRHHFNVIEGLADPDAPIVQAFAGKGTAEQD